MVSDVINAFRNRYRESMDPKYSPVRHVGFVFVVGAVFIVTCMCSLTDELSVTQALMCVLALLIFNVGEYMVHVQLGHNKVPWLKGVGALFYKRHTGDHHSFFGHERMAAESPMDWRVTFFPAWLVLVIIALAVISGYLVYQVFDRNASLMFMCGLVGGYLLYEWLHFCYHLPDGHRLVRLPWIKQMRHLHRIHHDRTHMQSKNFNLTFPLTDVLVGTFLWEPLTEHSRDNIPSD